jgi:riboflavin synthase
MFTGIVAARGIVKSIAGDEAGSRLAIDAGHLAGDLAIGASLAVNGVCLTAVAVEGTVVEVEAISETLHRTNLGALGPGMLVNLERPVGPADLFEGHLVQGHVDGVAVVRSVLPEGSSRRVWLDAPGDMLRYIVEKGSIALDGVSLTVADTDDSGFEVALIPHTLEVTGLGAASAGDRVNVELDVIAKYTERLVR